MSEIILLGQLSVKINKLYHYFFANKIFEE